MFDKSIALDLKARGVSDIEESIEKEELKEIIEKLEIPFEKENYFVKKAEERLRGILAEKKY